MTTMGHFERHGLCLYRSHRKACNQVEELTPHIIQIVDELLEPVTARGKMDVITELAYPLPMRVIAEMLGLRLEDQAYYTIRL